MTVSEKMGLLRQQMATHQLDAYLVPSSDPHQSEYLSAHWQSRAWLSGFSGSAGTLVVLPEEAGLWTDSRYFIQAEQELAGSSIALHQQLVPHAPEHIAWLRDHLQPGARIGIDGRLFSAQQARYLEKQFYPKNIQLDYTLDLIAPIWADRPPLPEDPVYEHDITFTGQSRNEKLESIRQALAHPTSTLLCSALDDIAWALNLRGSDIDCNPLFMAYLLISPAQATLYVAPEKISASLKSILEADHIILRPYEAVWHDLERLKDNTHICLDPSHTSIALYSRLDHTRITEIPSPIQHLKAIKNPTEIRHIRETMRKDGVALLRLLCWLESTLENNQHTITEYDVAQRLAAFRAEQPDYKGESFPAIVGYGANGAIVHYRPQKESAAAIHPEDLLLLDSGGQYLDGTTDITRTIALGPPTAEQKRAYTLVLKGHIALASVRFPEGTVGMQLDTLARLPLWMDGLAYGHGTGHGVGFFLSVHEGPNGFAASPTTSRGATPFRPGMLTSNEPGYYPAGKYGVRIENLLLCTESKEYPGFLHFETVSLFPIDTALIDIHLLHPEELQWLNDYHQKVFDSLAPLLEAEEVAWLKAKCHPL
jgi:Xaa-Pro aminopeptidase